MTSLITISGKEDVLRKAVEKWGDIAQLGQLMEECGELIVASSKVMRGTENCMDNFHEEIADVYIMINQMLPIPGVDVNEVQRVVDYKIKKLKDKLD